MSTYINSAEHLAYGDDCEAHDWNYFTQRRLAWLYGPAFANERHAQTQADIEAWNRLGTREAA